MRRLFPLPLVILIWLLLYVVLLGVRPMAAPDEYRYAEIPREMRSSGDWVVPHLDGMPYFEKPVLGYWATALSMAVFGENSFAARFPSAVGAGLMAIAVFLFMTATHDRRMPALAAGMLLSSLLVVATGSTALLDALFTGFLSLAVLGFYRALGVSPGQDDRPWLALGGICIGLSFLVKGFLAIVIPGLVFLPWLLMTRSLATFLRRLWIPLAWAVLVAAPWSILVGLRSEFWQHFFWVEHVQRFLDPGENQHVEPFWFFLPRLLAGLVPWIALVPVSVAGLRRLEDPAHRRLGLFALVWALIPLLFFSMSSGKLVTYILPCIPPLVILLALGLEGYLRSGARRFLGLVAFMEILPAIAVPAYLFWAGQHPQPVTELIIHAPTRWIPLVGGALFCGLFGFLAMMRGSSGRRLGLMLMAPVFFFAGIQLSLDAELLRSPGALVQAVKHELSPETVLVGNGNTVQALCWESRRTDIEVYGNPTELAYGLKHTPGRELLDLEGLKSRVNNAPAGLWLLLNNARWKEISAAFPRQRELARDRHFTLVELHASGE